MMEMLEGMASDLAMENGEAVMAAVEFEKALLNIAHTLAGQAGRGFRVMTRCSGE